MPIAAGIADLGAVAVLILALLVLLAAEALAQILAAVFGVLPIIGGAISSTIRGPIASAIRSAAGWAGASIGNLVGVIWTPITWLAALFARTGEGLWAALQAAERIVTTAIPNALTASANFATSLYHAAIAAVNAAEGQVADFATTLYHQAVGFAQGLYNSAVAFAQSLYAAAIAYVDATAGRIADFATSLYHQAISYAQALVAPVVAWVQQAIATLQADVFGRIGQTEAWVQQEVGALDTEVQGAYRAATDYASTVAAAAAAPAIALATTVAGELEQYLENCGRNLCAGLNPLSTALQALEGLVEGGLLFALIAAAASDPAGVAGEIESVVGPVVNGAASVFGDVVGVAA